MTRIKLFKIKQAKGQKDQSQKHFFRTLKYTSKLEIKFIIMLLTKTL